MPTFGEYETVGDPMRFTEDRGHTTTTWKACRNGARDGTVYVVKCFAPLSRTSVKESGPEDSLDSDSGLEFLESVRQLRDAQRNGGERFLAPIRDVGPGDSAYWYAARFCERGSLRGFIAKEGKIDCKMLAHIVYCVASGCVALQHSNNRSHGNLKPSNILLVGKTRPLLRTPLHLIDPIPASLIRAPGLDSDERETVGKDLRNAIELRDLQAIGLLILQLVERRIIESEFDYDLPEASSPEWKDLGRDGQQWCDLCNQLLDPHLSLDDITLESLAKKFRPSRFEQNLGLIQGNLRVILAAIGVMVFVAALVLTVQSLFPKLKEHRRIERERQYTNALISARAAFEQPDFPKAITEANRALRLKPNDAEALKLKRDAENARTTAAAAAEQERKYQDAIRLGRSALTDKEYDNAIAEANRALVLKPNDAEALKLKRDAESARTTAAAAAEQERKYQDAIRLGRSALTDKEYDNAIAEANRALVLKPNDADALKLKRDAENARTTAAAAAEQERKYQDAIRLGRSALTDKEYDNAIAEANRALVLKPNDAEALKLKRDAESARTTAAAAAEQERKYQDAIRLARSALTDKEYDNAIAEANRALVLKPNDADALKLKRDAESARTTAAAAAERETNYQKAMQAGRSALTDKEYDNAIAQANRALVLKPNDAEALKLKRDAESARTTAAAAAERETNYQKAMQAGRSALTDKEYDNAIAQANRALVLKPNDAEALKLKRDAESARTTAAAAAERESNYQKAMQAGRSALTDKEYDNAIAQANRALVLKPNDAEALKLRRDAESARTTAAAAAERETNYQKAMQAGRSALTDKEYDNAIAEANRALVLKPNDAEALKLRRDAESARTTAAAAAERESNYQKAMQAGRSALTDKEYDNAIAEANRALVLKPNDAEALKLRRDAESARTTAAAAAERETNYQKAMQAGRSALTDKEYDNAIAEANRALVLKPNDAEALKLRRDAESARTTAAAAAERESNYQKAMQAGRSALTDKEYDNAIAEANRALVLKPNDAEALKLKRDAESARTTAAAAAEQARKLDVEYQTADKAFQEGSYEQALKVCEAHNGTNRFDQLAQQIRKEEALFNAHTQAVGLGRYEEILQANLPEKVLFQTLKAQAMEENSALQNAKQQLLSGEYAFIKLLEQKSYKAKPPFVDVLEAGRKELEMLENLRALQKADQRQAVRDTLAKMAEEVRGKKPFGALLKWATSTETESQTGDLSRLDETLEVYEVWFRLKEEDPRIVYNGKPAKQLQRGNIAKTYLSGCLDQAESLRTAYQNAGALDSNRRADRLKKLVNQIQYWNR